MIKLSKSLVDPKFLRFFPEDIFPDDDDEGTSFEPLPLASDLLLTTLAVVEATGVLVCALMVVAVLVLVLLMLLLAISILGGSAAKISINPNSWRTDGFTDQ